LARHSSIALPIAGAFLVLGLAGCPSYAEQLQASSDFGKSAQAIGALAGVPGIVEGFCRQDAEVAYLTARVTGQTPPSFTQYYQAPRQSPAGPLPAWKNECDLYKPADDGFMKAVQVLSAYGQALSDVDADSIDTSSDVKGLVSAVATDTATLAPSLGGYKQALSGLGGPLAYLASGLETRWVGGRIRSAVFDANCHVRDLVAMLESFIDTLRRERVESVRRDVASLVKATAGGANGALGGLVDVTFTDALETADAQLVSLSAALDKLGRANAKLVDSWSHASDVAGLGDAKAVGDLAVDILNDVNAFRNPQKGGGK